MWREGRGRGGEGVVKKREPKYGRYLPVLFHGQENDAVSAVVVVPCCICTRAEEHV